jgi:hypothetical protein
MCASGLAKTTAPGRATEVKASEFAAVPVATKNTATSHSNTSANFFWTLASSEPLP